MTELRVTNDPTLSIARGLFPNLGHVNKFGRTTNADAGTPCDIWDRANPTDNQPVWLAPTTPRIHALVSTLAADSDVGGVTPQGAGARTVRVWGLQTWASVETFEDVVLDGVVPVNTSNSYVIIHRIQVLTSGLAGPNVGTISATAAVDATVTAQIQPLEGQTLMAIYGVPSVQTAYMTGFCASVESGTPSGANVDIRLRWCLDVVNDPTVFQTKHVFGVDDASGPFHHPYNPYKRFVGPGIIKILGISDSNNSVVDGCFDLILEDN